ncbi:MAG: hypothetical protein VBE63_26970 [Lamprobacter sp.]|uniref:hypothetical protein n=1 Tax=Lamprobacter sp. TaxID=3100796 RepID=UPI002B2582AF|nr:hypothetical protein [Lamprobacter sp.]MEA3643543.1 hypothetical protein [Lamprobacter sp.]
MHRLSRPSAPRCLGRFRHGRNLQTAEEIFSLALEFEDSDWQPILDQELNDIAGKPFETAIRHVLQIR